MSEGLRAEDVEQALEWFDTYGPREDLLPQAHVLAAAARAWLASQATTEGRYVEPTGSSEQTPDYEAAAKALIDDPHCDDETNAEVWRDLASTVKEAAFRQAHAAVDAALVGFNRTAGEQSLGLGPNPQPEGDD